MMKSPAEPSAQPAAAPTKHRGVSGLLFLLVFVTAAMAAIYAANGKPSFDDPIRHVRNIALSEMYRTIVKELLLNPWFYLVYVVVLALEHMVPARVGQSSLRSTGSRYDFLWIFIKLPVFATLMPAYYVLLRYCYDSYLGFLTIDSVALLPPPIKAVFALAMADLAFWFSHLVRHRIRVLWHFHAVHHSQRELNFFSDWRSHPLDDVFLYTLNFIPLFMVDQGFATVMAIVWLQHWHTRVYHSNIRSNFGWLRYVLVTPQSHRVHHSREPQHQDKNFGLTFSIWDHLFGTQHTDYNDYPETGIEDDSFPVEQEKPGPLTLFMQLVYPFQASLRR